MPRGILRAILSVPIADKKLLNRNGSIISPRPLLDANSHTDCPAHSRDLTNKDGLTRARIASSPLCGCRAPCFASCLLRSPSLGAHAYAFQHLGRGALILVSRIRDLFLEGPD